MELELAREWGLLVHVGAPRVTAEVPMSLESNEFAGGHRGVFCGLIYRDELSDA